MRAAATWIAVGVFCLPLLAGCGGSPKPVVAASRAPSPAATRSVAACPSPPAARTDWPRGVPSTFPRLPGATDYQVQPGQSGLQILKFTSPISLEQAVLFVLKALPHAGFVIGRGDAEAFEADAPFVGDGFRGLLRLDATSSCSIVGLLAITRLGQGPGALLPSHSESPAPSG
jgi:hypothetical protein